MAFVNEIIHAEDKKRYDFSVIKRPNLYADPVCPSTWTIDRERNVFLVRTRGGTEDHQNLEQFALWWNGDVIRVNTELEANGKFKEHVDITWTLLDMRIPASLQVPKDEVIQVLKEALRQYRVGVRIPVASCTVSFTF